MNMQHIKKWAALLTLLVLPFLVYYAVVYSAKENFFVTLAYVGPKEVVEVQDASGAVVTDTMAYSVPDFDFVNQDGAAITKDSLLGKITVVSFFFTRCPSICPSMNFHIRKVQERFKGFDHFRILSHTVDPMHDSVAVLKKYAEQMLAEPKRWNFVTGKREALYSQAANYFQSAQEDSTAAGGFLHTEQLVLVDWEGRIRSRKDDLGNVKGSYNSLSAVELDELIEDIKVLIAEYEKERSKREYQLEKAAKKR